MAYLFYGLLVAIGAYVLMQIYANSTVQNIRRVIGGFGLVVIVLLLTMVVTAAMRGNVGFLAALIILVPALVKMVRQLSADGMGPTYSGRSSSSSSSMTRSEALDVLSLKEGASEDEIKASYRDLMRSAHPDHGGSEWMATKLNEAKQVLLDK